MIHIEKIESDHKKMAAFIGSQIRGEWTTIELTTTNGTATVVVFPCRDEETGEWDIHLEADADWVAVTDVYKYYREQVELAWERQERRLNFLRIVGLEREVADLRKRVEVRQRQQLRTESAPERAAKRVDGVLDQELLTLSEAAKLIPGRKAGKRIYTNTLWRWCSQGVRGVRLRSVLIGGQRYTTRQWIEEFMSDGLEGGNDQPDATKIRTPNQRQTASERAADELRARWNQDR